MLLLLLIVLLCVVVVVDCCVANGTNPADNNDKHQKCVAGRRTGSQIMTSNVVTQHALPQCPDPFPLPPPTRMNSIHPTINQKMYIGGSCGQLLIVYIFNPQFSIICSKIKAYRLSPPAPKPSVISPDPKSSPHTVHCCVLDAPIDCCIYLL